MRDATADFKHVQNFRNKVQAATADFHPVQNMRHLMAETGKTIEKAEESAMKGATRVYESLVPAGSQMEKQLTATTQQMAEAWNSVKNMRESLSIIVQQLDARHRFIFCSRYCDGNIRDVAMLL